MVTRNIISAKEKETAPHLFSGEGKSAEPVHSEVLGLWWAKAEIKLWW